MSRRPVGLASVRLHGGCTALVTGEAGIGKTALLQEFAARQGGHDEAGGDPPFHSAVSAARPEKLFRAIYGCSPVRTLDTGPPQPVSNQSQAATPGRGRRSARLSRSRCSPQHDITNVT